MLIQDIRPPERKKIVRRVVQVHRATDLTTLPERMRQVRADVMAPPQTRPRPIVHRPVPRSVPTIPKKQHTPWVHKVGSFMQYPLIAALAIALAYSSVVGQIVILVYAVVSIVFRVSSTYTFITALLTLIAIPFFQAIDQTGVAQNAAIYTYELLVVGTIQIIIEQWRERHMHSRGGGL